MARAFEPSTSMEAAKSYDIDIGPSMLVAKSVDLHDVKIIRMEMNCTKERDMGYLVYAIGSTGASFVPMV